MCYVEGCNNPYHAKGYCNKHYLQERQHGAILERTTFDKNDFVMHDDYAELKLYNIDSKCICRTLIDLSCVERYLNINGVNMASMYVAIALQAFTGIYLMLHPMELYTISTKILWIIDYAIWQLCDHPSTVEYTQLKDLQKEMTACHGVRVYRGN